MIKLNFHLSTMALIVAFIMIPFLASAQKKNVVSTHRVFPKIDKVMEFEKALAAHAQKYHTGDVAWRVFEIQSGPDFGAFHITEGPTSWEGFDSRGNLGEEHTMDWNKNVCAYLTDRQSAGYAVYEDSLSTVAMGDHADKINITHLYPKMGKGPKVREMIKKLRKSWMASGSTVAVYTSNSSGSAQYTIVTRYKQGLKEKAEGFRKPFKETYEGVNGEDSYTLFMEDLSEYVDKTWSELLFLRPELGSK
ncbi:MAG: hypothetical protein IPN29_00475 [Saprospiraceae bacterium]|nr:hypothetical protein [Saprospiraceae bacterium]